MDRKRASGSIWTEVIVAEDRARLRRLLAGRCLWLASSSPRRRDILRACGVRFRTVGHPLREPSPAGPDWRAWVRRWAELKAAAAARSLRDGWVIGSDTIVVCGDRGLGKPTDGANARWTLEQLSGHVHQVYSGVAVVDARTRASATGSAVTHVHFRRLLRKEIDAYVRTGESSDKAGAYAIQGRARAFVLKVDGPMDNVIGLPVKTLIRVLERIRW